MVILDSGETPRIEVVDLPESATLGTAFCHLGRMWLVTGLRSRSRVLFAQPSE